MSGEQRPPEVVGQPATSEASSPSPAADIRRRAFAGIALLGARGVVIRVVALAGNIALARLLTPAQFGTIAFGLAIITFVELLSDGGLGVALVRRPEAPTREELRCLIALQLTMTAAIGAVVAAIGVWLGGIGEVTAVMIVSLPIIAIRVPALIALERDLVFSPIALAEAGEVAAYYAWAITAVAVGFGVWGLATASIVKAVTGTVILLPSSPAGALKPLFSVWRIRPLLAFGLRFQLVTFAQTVRDQGVNIGTAAIGGTATLGLWTLASRVLQLPFLLFESLWRVSYPAMAQLIQTGEDPRLVIERGVRLASTLTGVLLTPLIASAPALVAAVFGARWDEAGGVVLPACLALQVSGPISVATAGYLFAIGRPDVVLRSAILSGAVWFAVTFPLLPAMGVTAVGVGWFAAALSEAAILSHATRQETGARLAPQSAVQAIATALAGTTLWLVFSELGNGAVAAIGGLVSGGVLYLALVLTMRRPLLVELIDLAHRGRRALRSRKVG